MTEQISFRPFTDDDLEFLLSVYASTREEELAAVPWSDEEKDNFLRMQFRAQHVYYQENFPNARFEIIHMGEVPIGRLYVDRRDDEMRIIDIALLTTFRGQGVGGQIMKDLLDESAADKKPVTIHVVSGNVAMRLYQRLGFQEIADVGVYSLMRWSP